jgi:hypothetical protein
MESHLDSDCLIDKMADLVPKPEAAPSIEHDDLESKRSTADLQQSKLTTGCSTINDLQSNSQDPPFSGDSIIKSEVDSLDCEFEKNSIEISHQSDDLIKVRSALVNVRLLTIKKKCQLIKVVLTVVIDGNRCFFYLTNL